MHMYMSKYRYVYVYEYVYVYAYVYTYICVCLMEVILYVPSAMFRTQSVSQGHLKAPLELGLLSLQLLS